MIKPCLCCTEESLLNSRDGRFFTCSPTASAGGWVPTTGQLSLSSGWGEYQEDSQLSSVCLASVLTHYVHTPHYRNKQLVSSTSSL